MRHCPHPATNDTTNDLRSPTMGVIAAILFGIAFFLNGTKTSTDVWFSPNSLMLAGLCCLALHLLGVGSGWYSRRR